jgi:hypothetical protein
MARIATLAPTDDVLLCEGCGYTLTGLPTDSRCPECGKPIAESVGAHRRPPAWEQDGPRPISRFLSTMALAIFRPTHFYRIINTRSQSPAARHFAHILWFFCALLFAVSAVAHLLLFQVNPTQNPWWAYAAVAPMTAFIYVLLWMTNRIAARLTAWEANYRGLRVPQAVALRGLWYHASHYVPVTLIATATVLGYRLGIDPRVHWFGWQTSQSYYLYVLSAEVVLAAAYLFHTYWIGMRNMMYANQ